ncbi:MAG: MCE family protein [Rhodocyclales bacterium]|nr:MCE family protein [Rhodocyclales bacterium]
MSDAKKLTEPATPLPEARLRKTWRIFRVVWVVPLLAVVVAAYVVVDRIREMGPAITIMFKDVNGLKIGQTPIKYRGVPIGEVTAFELNEDLQQVRVTARLQRAAAAIAREGSAFWIVRPEVGAASITGLGTVISGPEIGVLPGSGKPRSDFVGLENSPVLREGKGLKVVLLSRHLKSLKPTSPIYYRGIEIGAVQQTQLGADATEAQVHVLIKQRYANLVRDGAKFWNVSGVDANIGLFSGVEINIESLPALMAGGIALAVPEGASARPVKDGAIFRLHEKPEQRWLQWAPKIALAAEK